MRKLLLFLWLLLPAGALAYHYGPGQERLRTDRAAEAIERAKESAWKARQLAAKEGDEAARALWTETEKACAEALDLLPADMLAESRALRLERAKAQMFISQLPDARRELAALVEELGSDPSADREQLRDARKALGNAQYYTTWLMRLEGAPREEWEPEIDAARQNYKLLAEEAAQSGDALAGERTCEDLESAVRLARMEIKDLQGLPLPSQ